MTLPMEQFRELLLDYVYGQLEGEPLRAFEDCLRESADCRRELALLQSTLQRARAGLASAAQAEDPAPIARMRSKVLAAAAEAHASARTSERVPAHLTRLRQVEPSAHSGLVAGALQWLRAPWLLPSLGVAAAVALLVLGRQVEPPDTHGARQAAPAASAAAHEPAVAPSAPAQVPGPSRVGESQSPLGQQAPADERQRPTSARSGAARARAPSKGFAAPPPAWVEEQPAMRERAVVEQRRAREEPGAPAAPAPARAEGSLSDGARGGVGPSAAPASGAAAATASRAARDDAHAELELAGKDKASAKSAQAPGRAPDAALHVASEHFMAQRFEQAAAAYRELLRRYPDDPRAAGWKRRLALSTSALSPDGNDSAR